MSAALDHRHIGFTAHAIERIAEMEVCKHEVRDAVKSPEMEYDGAKVYPPGRRVYVRGRLAVVVQVSTDEVVTVLWHTRTER